MSRPVPTRAQAITGPRSPRWLIELLDERDRPKGTLGTIRDGSISLSSTDRLGGSASLVIDERTGQRIDWLNDRCRITYDPGVPGWQAWELGVYLFSSPTRRVGSLTISHEVELQTKLLILDEATVGGPWGLAAGSNLVQTVTDMIATTGETRIAATPSQAASSSDIAYDGGEYLLTIINDLLEAANYFALHTDGSGQYVVTPYTVPGERPIAWRFAAGETAIHAPDWVQTQDRSSVPNRVEVHTAGSDEEPPIIGVATNQDPASPYSIQARGRWVTRREQVEAASQAEADAIAARYLIGGMSPLSKLSVAHAMVPVRPRQVVAFKDRGIDTLATIQKMEVDIAFDAQVRAEWVEVSPLAVSTDHED